MMVVGGLLGLVIGAILGLTGAGGGIFAVPALVFGLGMDMRTAAPVALLAVGAAAGLGALQGLRQDIVRYKAGATLAAAGALTAPLGVILAHQLPSSWLSLMFAVVMFVVAWRMFMSARGAVNSDGMAEEVARVCRISSETGRFIWNSRTAATLAGIGAISGLFTGMLGVGGGFIIVPALAYFTELRMNSIVATSLMVIALLSGVAVFAAWGAGLSLTGPAWMFSITAIAGMAAGRILAPRIPAAMLQRIFAILCVFVAGMMLMRGAG